MKAPFPLRRKLFPALAAIFLIGICGATESAVREHRDLAFDELKRAGERFTYGVALSNAEAILKGDEKAYRDIASNLMRRPELRYIRFESPGSDDPFTVERADFSSPAGSLEVMQGEMTSSRLMSREGRLLLEVMVPLSSVVAALPLEQAPGGGVLTPTSGSLGMGFDAARTQAALVASSRRLRMAHAAIAAFVLFGSWLAVRRAVAPFELLGNAAQSLAAGSDAVDLPAPRTKEAYLLTLGLEVIQKRMKRRIGKPRSGSAQLASRLGAVGKARFGGRLSDRLEAGVLDRDGETMGHRERDHSTDDSHHVLLVEDNPVNRSVAVGMLESLDCTIVCVEDGLASLVAMEAQPFDLVFMDIQMPRMDGHEATRRIRDAEERAGARPTPIVALTAHSQEEDRAASAAAGMNGHISKPFTREDLRGALEEWCGSRKSERPDAG